MNTTFERSNNLKDEWLTPPDLLKKLGPFDLDPCAPIKSPWPIAKNHFTYLDNGLMKDWCGRVFCNPPYGKHLESWLNKCALHKNVTLLIFARTDTNAFFNYLWPFANSILFIKGRLKFYNVDGTPAKTQAGAPSILVSFDKTNTEYLIKSNIKGKLIKL